MERPRSIIGQSSVWRRTLDLCQQAAPSSATVLFQGESGTGKELLARMIHQFSPRTGNPLVAFNCAAFPDTLIESELFGYEKGAFTGAIQRREGRFELAHKGTIFLDEVGEMTTQAQVKLLRVLQEGELERLGGTDTVRVDVRVCAATKRDLFAEVQAGRFREDLYYRLNVITITVPPLRDRKEDIPLLTAHFLAVYADKNHCAHKALSSEAMQVLCEYDWPGNVRELENTIERAVVMTRSDVIAPADLPEQVRRTGTDSRALTIAIGTPLEEVERRVILETLRQSKGDKRTAAQLLGIATRTIYRKLDEWDRGKAAGAPATPAAEGDGGSGRAEQEPHAPQA